MESQTPLIAAAETAIVEISSDAITGRSALSQKYRAYTLFSLLVMSAWSWFYMGLKNTGNNSVPGGEVMTAGGDDVVVAEQSRTWHQRGGNLMVWFGDFAYGGVDHLLSGNGGAICMNYIPYWQRILETVMFLGLAGWMIRSSFTDISHHYMRIKVANDDADVKRRKESDLASTSTPVIPTTFLRWRACVSNRVVFNSYFAVFALELAYKALTRTMIFLLNPCHVTTAIQLALLKFLVVEDDYREKRNSNKPAHQLAQRGNRLDDQVARYYRNGEALASAMFLVHMYLIPGAILALFFPVLNTRLMVGEVMIYFVQHLFILFIPVYLMRQRPDIFVPEPFYDVSWTKFSVSALFIYHFAVLQLVSIVTLVNLNGMLCPMVSDPFAGPVWRICASLHQSVYIPLAAKFYALAARRLNAASIDVVEAVKREL